MWDWTISPRKLKRTKVIFDSSWLRTEIRKWGYGPSHDNRKAYPYLALGRSLLRRVLSFAESSSELWHRICANLSSFQQHITDRSMIYKYNIKTRENTKVECLDNLEIPGDKCKREISTFSRLSVELENKIIENCSIVRG